MSGVLILTPLSIAVWKKGESQYRSRGRLLALRVGLKTYAPLVAGGWDVVINVVKDVRVCSCSHPFPDAVNGKALLFSTFLLHLLTLHRWPARANGKWQYHPPRTCQGILFLWTLQKDWFLLLVNPINKRVVHTAYLTMTFETAHGEGFIFRASTSRDPWPYEPWYQSAVHLPVHAARCNNQNTEREESRPFHIDVRLSTVDEVYLYKIVL